jgi:uncharacterized protein YecA (UPF0149 family)
MSLFDRFSKRYERKREERKLRDQLTKSDDDVPIPDMPVEQASRERSTGRNDPCPCGSGKKYKKCCGKDS